MISDVKNRLLISVYEKQEMINDKEYQVFLDAKQYIGLPENYVDFGHKFNFKNTNENNLSSSKRIHGFKKEFFIPERLSFLNIKANQTINTIETLKIIFNRKIIAKEALIGFEALDSRGKNHKSFLS